MNTKFSTLCVFYWNEEKESKLNTSHHEDSNFQHLQTQEFSVVPETLSQRAAYPSD